MAQIPVNLEIMTKFKNQPKRHSEEQDRLLPLRHCPIKTFVHFSYTPVVAISLALPGDTGAGRALLR